DINTAVNTGSSPTNTAAIGGAIYFSAFTSTNGSELYKSDGTTAGTVLFKDLVVGGGGSYPNNFTALGSSMVFSAQIIGSGNTELWTSDGTANGTVVLKDINVGTNSSSPTNFAVVGNTAYFSASDGTTTGLHGTELWKTDGTAAGTVMTLDLNPGTLSSSPTVTTPALGTVFFAATTAAVGNEPHRLRTNAAPVAANDSFSTRISSPHTFPAPGVLANDTDADGDALTAGSASAPTSGTVTLSTDGSFTYTPATGFSGTASFTYVASDGGGGTATGTVTMTVAGTNTAPTAVSDSYTTNEDTPLTVAAPGVVGNDTDAEADTLTARRPGRTVSDGATTFANNVSSATANFTALDVGASITGSSGIPAGARISTVTSPTTATLSANVTGQFTGITLTITPQPGAASATLHGTITLNLDGSFTYSPAVNYNGGDSFTYVADDGYGGTATATVTITIN
ncbi:MAG: tandem-95 repeat protein, partial [Actinobacteria bacterium]|nr:tandem-95 repeat protein [Actinomycetota bacterium]